MFQKLLVLLLIASPIVVLSASVWEGKEYKNTKSENFEEYMKALGVGYFLRKIANNIQPTIELRRNGTTYTLLTTSTFKSSVLNFELGKPFDEETLDGRHVKSVFTMDGDNKLIQKQGGEPTTEVFRVFGDKKMVATMKVGDIVCTRTYEAKAKE